MNYRLLRVELTGKVSEVLVVNVADKQAALARAQGFGHYQAVEIWCGDRAVTVAKPVTAPPFIPTAECC